MMTVTCGVYAYTPSPSEKVVCLVLDDGFINQYDNAVPILEAHGFRATFFVMANTAENPTRMNWTILTDLANRGHDIQCHSYSHANLTELTTEELYHEVVESKDVFASHGFDTKLFSYPYGQFNDTVLNLVNQHYSLSRGTNWGMNSLSSPDFVLRGYGMKNTTTFDQFRSFVDQALGDQSVIVFYHRVEEIPGSTYSTSIADFTQQVQYLHENGFTVLTMSEAFLTEPPQSDPSAQIAPEASFTYSPMNPTVNETITFDASACSDTDGTIINYIWDFGDDTTGAGITTTHSYVTDGTYTVTLTITDNDGLTDTITQTINNVIPEFISLIILPLVLLITVIATVYKTKLTKDSWIR